MLQNLLWLLDPVLFFLCRLSQGIITCLGCEAVARPPGCPDLRPLEHCATHHQALVAGAPLGGWLFPIRDVLATSLATHIITHTYCLRMPLTWNNFKGSSPGSSPESPGPGRSCLYPGTCWPPNKGIPGTELRTSLDPLHTTSWHCLALPSEWTRASAQGRGHMPRHSPSTPCPCPGTEKWLRWCLFLGKGWVR